MAQVVLVVMLSCVFKVLNLEHAQFGGLSQFWAHDLQKLSELIAMTR